MMSPIWTSFPVMIFSRSTTPTIKPGHLGRLTTNQSAAIVLAGIRNALNHFFGDGGIKHTRCQIIHEEQRSGSLNGNVVHTVIYEVCADSGVQVHLEGDLQLRAY